MPIRDNFGRFQKQATINLTKKLQETAKKKQIAIQHIIAEQLYETYTKNVLESYTPRGDGSYVHTDLFLDSIYVEIEDDKVQIKIENNTYDQLSGRTTEQVHKFLTEGTDGGGKQYGVYKYISDNGMIYSAYNYPTPKHNFEEHTQVQMNGFLEDLKNDIENKKTRR